MTTTGIGTSTHSNPFKAFDTAFQQLTINLSGHLPNVIFCFSKFNTEEIQTIAHSLKDQNPQALIIGSHAQTFTSNNRFSIILYALSSEQLQASSRVFPISNSLIDTNNHIEEQSIFTFILACSQTNTIDSLLSSINTNKSTQGVTGIVEFGPMSWVLHNESIFRDMAIRVDISETNINFSTWNVNIPVGISHTYSSNDNICEFIANQPAAFFYQRYITPQFISLSPFDQKQLFTSYPLCFQQKQSFQLISPLSIGPQNTLILPITPSSQANAVTIALENVNSPNELIKQAITHVPANSKQTPLLFTTAARNFPTFINKHEQQFFANEKYPEPIRISTEGIIFNNKTQTPSFTSNGRLLLNFS